MKPITLLLSTLFFSQILSLKIIDDIQADPNDLNPPKWNKCDAGWGKDQLGDCAGKTICSDGDYVTLVAMYLSVRGYKGNPGDLNKWLTEHNGYTARCDIRYEKIDDLGIVKYKGKNSLDPEEACSRVDKAHGLICKTTDADEDNVLITGCDWKSSMYRVIAPDYPLTGISMRIAGPFHIFE